MSPNYKYVCQDFPPFSDEILVKNDRHDFVPLPLSSSKYPGGNNSLFFFSQILICGNKKQFDDIKCNMSAMDQILKFSFMFVSLIWFNLLDAKDRQQIILSNNEGFIIIHFSGSLNEFSVSYGICFGRLGISSTKGKSQLSFYKDRDSLLRRMEDLYHHLSKTTQILLLLAQ